MSDNIENNGQAPGGPLPCPGGCGLFGNPNTMNMCSSCYRLHMTKQDQNTSQSSSLGASTSLQDVDMKPLDDSEDSGSPLSAHRIETRTSSSSVPRAGNDPAPSAELELPSEQHAATSGADRQQHSSEGQQPEGIAQPKAPGSEAQANPADQAQAADLGERKKCEAGCGFFGSPQYNGMCSKCYRQATGQAEEQRPASASNSTSTSSSSSAASTSSSSDSLCKGGCGFFGNSNFEGYCSKCYRSLHPERFEAKTAAPSPPAAEEKKDTVHIPADRAEQKNKSRCFACNKKVGLTAIQCKCGFYFCGKHRYPEEHNCEFDFKTAGRVKLEKDNPLVRGKKLVRIDSDS